MDCSVVVLCSVQKQLLFRSSWKPRIQKAQRAKAKFVISCSTVVPFQEETKPSSALQPNSEDWFLPGLGFGWGLSAASTSQRSRTLQEGIAGRHCRTSPQVFLEFESQIQTPVVILSDTYNIYNYCWSENATWIIMDLHLWGKKWRNKAMAAAAKLELRFLQFQFSPPQVHPSVATWP